MKVRKGAGERAYRCEGHLLIVLPALPCYELEQVWHFRAGRSGAFVMMLPRRHRLGRFLELPPPGLPLGLGSRPQQAGAVGLAAEKG